MIVSLDLIIFFYFYHEKVFDKDFTSIDVWLLSVLGIYFLKSNILLVKSIAWDSSNSKHWCDGRCVSSAFVFTWRNPNTLKFSLIV